MKKIIGGLTLLFFIFSAPAFAAELKVVTENWKPYNYEENGVIKGNSTKIVKAVLDNAQIPYDIKVYQWTEAYEIAQKEADTLIYTINRTPQRENLFKWASSLGKDIQYSLYRLKKNDHIIPTSLNEAKKYKIGSQKDASGDIWLKSQSVPNVVASVKLEETVKKLFNGEVDLIIAASNIITAIKKAGFNPDEAVAVLPVFQTTPYMALSLSTSDEVLRKIRQSYDALLKDNKIKIDQ
jgi:polar amino acid transport system substrate-binding protein